MLRVMIRKPTISDCDDFLILTRASVSFHHPWIQAPLEETTFRSYLERIESANQEGFLLYLGETGEIIGLVNVSEIVRGAFHSAYLGFWIGAKFSGRGLMREGLARVIEHAFTDLSLHRLEANVQPGNSRSRSLVHSLGFTREGSSKRYLKIAGGWRDHERWAILAENWPGVDLICSNVSIAEKSEVDTRENNRSIPRSSPPRESHDEPYALEAASHLPDHHRVLTSLFDFFLSQTGVSGAFVSGSVAGNRMDEDSDIDVGIVFDTAASRERVWRTRWDWPIGSWFHRFDADHIKSYFIIYFYDPAIKADICLYCPHDLPKREGEPFRIVDDRSGVLKTWLEELSTEAVPTPDWSAVIHEDERFWAWLFYLYAHLHRGETYHCADEFPILRRIVETWTARLNGEAQFSTRRLEWHRTLSQLRDPDLFPAPSQESVRRAALSLINRYLQLRSHVSERFSITWSTSSQAIEKIRGLLNNIDCH